MLRGEGFRRSSGRERTWSTLSPRPTRCNVGRRGPASSTTYWPPSSGMRCPTSPGPVRRKLSGRKRISGNTTWRCSGNVNDAAELRRHCDTQPARSFLAIAAASAHAGAMILTTTPAIDGRPIQTYLGLVTGEAILGANLFRDLFAGIRDVVGGRSAAYEKELANARETAVREMTERAQQLGADAIVGIDLDYEVLGAQSSMLMVNASGTAVKLS